MGCSIYAFVEKRSKQGGWEWCENLELASVVRLTHMQYAAKTPQPFNVPSDGLYGIIDAIGLRDIPAVVPVVASRGLPSDLSQDVADERASQGSDVHSDSWLTLYELLEFRWDTPVEDCRITADTAQRGIGRQPDGSFTIEPGHGQMTTYRQMLNPLFFTQLNEIEKQTEGTHPRDVRIVFWFDN